MKKHDDMSTHKKRTNVSPRFIGNMLLLLFAVLVVVALGVLSTQSQNVAHSATQNTSSQNNDITATVQATPAPAAVKVNVTLSEFKITSSITTFKVGTPYYFTVTNRGHSLHEFLIMPDKPNGTNYLVNGEYRGQVVQGQAVQSGATLMVNYTFTPSSTTKYEIACLMRGHYAAGMSRPIVVTK